MREETVIFGVEKHLVATLTIADPSSAAPRWVAVLTNSGVIPRSGPHRMNVRLARRFAQMGISSVRFDMSGLGDSRRSTSTVPSAQQWVADTRAVMDGVAPCLGCERFFMVGFCSGAEVAHLVALEDRRLRAAVLWDHYAHPTLRSKFITLRYRLARAGMSNALRKLAWRTFPALKGLARGEDRSDRSVALPAAQVPPLSEYGARYQRLVDDGVELLFAYSGGEPEWFNHKGQFRAMFGRFGFVDKVAFTYLKQSDHLITQRESQVAFTDMTVQWLEQRVLPET